LASVATISPSVLVFFSGICTSLATNLFTGSPSFSKTNLIVYGLGHVQQRWIYDTRSMSLLLIGVCLFIIGWAREESGRTADYVRGDETTEEEYLFIVFSGLKKRRKAVLISLIISSISVSLFILCSFALTL
jgi:hypothetical protein